MWRPRALNRHVPLEWLHSSSSPSTSGHTQCCVHAFGGQPPAQELTITRSNPAHHCLYKYSIIAARTLCFVYQHLWRLPQYRSRVEWLSWAEGLTVYNHFPLPLHRCQNSCPLCPTLCLPVYAFQSQWQGIPPLIESFSPTQTQISPLIQYISKHPSQISRIVQRKWFWH